MNKINFFLVFYFSLHTTLYAKINILFIVNKFPSITETFILEQINGLIQRNYNISILASIHQKTDFLHEFIIKHNLMKKTKFIDFYNSANYTEDFIQYLKNFDILYCQYDRIGVVLAKIKQNYNLASKLVTCIRGGGLHGRIKNKKNDYINLFSVVDIFLPVCKAFANILRSAGCNEEKIIIHHSAIDCDKLTYHSRKEKKNLILLSIARLIESKGLEDSLDAVVQLIKEGFKIEYRIIGEGELREKLQKKIDQSGFNNRIKLLGWQKREIIRKELYEADIFLHTSRRGDGIPNAIMEAFAVGLPVITTRINGGNQEIVQHNSSGIVVQPQNINAIKKAIEYLIKNSKKRSLFGKRGRRYVQSYHNIIIENSKLDKILRGLLI